MFLRLFTGKALAINRAVDAKSQHGPVRTLIKDGKSFVINTPKTQPAFKVSHNSQIPQVKAKEHAELNYERSEVYPIY